MGATEHQGIDVLILQRLQIGFNGQPGVIGIDLSDLDQRRQKGAGLLRIPE